MNAPTIGKKFMAAVDAALEPPAARNIEEARRRRDTTQQAFLEASRRHTKAVERTRGDTSERAAEHVAQAKRDMAAAKQAAEAAAKALAEFSKPPTLRDRITGAQPEFPGGNPIVPYARHGITPEITIQVRNMLPIDQKLQELQDKLRASAVCVKNHYAEQTTLANKTAQQLYTDHLEAISTRLGTGEASGEIEAFSVSELQGEREALLRANKLAIKAECIKVMEIARPLFVMAEQAASKLLDQEIEAETARGKRFGIPVNEPSEILRSINAARRLYQSRAAKEHMHYQSSVEDLLCGLVEL